MKVVPSTAFELRNNAFISDYEYLVRKFKLKRYETQLGIKSDRTGKVVVWNRVLHGVNDNGKFILDKFYPSQEDVAENNKLNDYQVLIFAKY